MNPPDNDVLSVIKDWVWAPLLALIGWAWNRNEKEHDMLWKATTKLQEHTSTGYSTLNDKIMEHVDDQVSTLKTDHGKRIDKINDHITKLFENAEKDRAAFRETFLHYSERSEERHRELMKSQSEAMHFMHVALDKKADK